MFELVNQFFINTAYAGIGGSLGALAWTVFVHAYHLDCNQGFIAVAVKPDRHVLIALAARLLFPTWEYRTRFGGAYTEVGDRNVAATVVMEEKFAHVILYAMFWPVILAVTIVKVIAYELRRFVRSVGLGLANI